MAELEMIPIYIMGKRYIVPSTLTIMGALEYAGYTLIRGVGCRAAFCGACATVYRQEGDPKLYIGLACGTLVQPGMYLTQIPFYPADRAQYRLEELTPTFATLVGLYPQVLKCLGCGTCTKSCPQELEVMWFMTDALRGDIKAVAEKSFDCVMCGLCAARCPQGLAPYHVALLCRRLYGRYLAPASEHLDKRIAEIASGGFDAEIEELKRAGEKELRRLYAARDVEPALEQQWE